MTRASLQSQYLSLVLGGVIGNSADGSKAVPGTSLAPARNSTASSNAQGSTSANNQTNKTSVGKDSDTLRLEILKTTKRYHTTVSFLASTGLKEASGNVHKYNVLMKNFPLNELLLAIKLDKIHNLLVQISGHINKKLKVLPKPIQRALSLVEAISKYLTETLLKALTNHCLMYMNYTTFSKVIASTATETAQATPNYDWPLSRDQFYWAWPGGSNIGELTDLDKKDERHPHIAGAINWAKQIERQLLTYMKRAKDVLGRRWENYAEGSLLATDSNNLLKKLDTKPIFDQWVKDWTKWDMSITGSIFEIQWNWSTDVYTLAVAFNLDVIVILKEV
ncbi:dynein heavy chain, N-terminal region 1-domain-containing protein [Phakopsora pachyrhizi]|nr:dynein heavy chain, N-terminal region 1-domain-containing protein [Phakopsora pachyrhizi]